MGCVSSKTVAKASTYQTSLAEQPGKCSKDVSLLLASSQQNPTTATANPPGKALKEPTQPSPSASVDDQDDEQEEPSRSNEIHPAVMKPIVTRQRKQTEQPDINVNYSMRDSTRGSASDPSDNLLQDRNNSSPPKKQCGGGGPNNNPITMASNESFYKNSSKDRAHVGTANDLPYQPFQINSQGPRILGAGADKTSPLRANGPGMMMPSPGPGAPNEHSPPGTIRVSPVNGMGPPVAFQPVMMGRPVPPQVAMGMPMGFGRPPVTFMPPQGGRGRGAFAFDQNAFMVAQFGSPAVVGVHGVPMHPPRAAQELRSNTHHQDDEEDQEGLVDDDDDDDDDGKAEEDVGEWDLDDRGGERDDNDNDNDNDDDDDDDDGKEEEDVGEWDLGDQGENPSVTKPDTTEAESPSRASPSKVTIALSTPSPSPICKKKPANVMTNFGGNGDICEVVSDEEEEKLVDDDNDDDDDDGKDDEAVEDWIEETDHESSTKDVKPSASPKQSPGKPPSVQATGSTTPIARGSPGQYMRGSSSPVQNHSPKSTNSSPKASPPPPLRANIMLGAPPSGSNSPPRILINTVPPGMSPPKPGFETSSTTLHGPHPYSPAMAMGMGMGMGMGMNMMGLVVSVGPNMPPMVIPANGTSSSSGSPVGGPPQSMSLSNAAGTRDTKVVKKKKAELPQQQNLPHPVPKFGDWLNSRTMINNYIILESLGAGSYAEVKLCKEKITGKLFAMKFINRDIVSKHDKLGKGGAGAAAVASNSKFDEIKREIAIMKKLKHPNVLRLYEVMDDPKMNKLFLVLEYMKYGDLMSHQKKKYGDVVTSSGSSALMNDRDLHCVVLQVLLGLAYLHEQKIVHGDIKPQNLLVGDNDVVKIADFGISQSLYGSKQKLMDTVGTPAFMAPEICGGVEYSGQLADVWAVGATVFMLKYGNPPFVAKTALQLFEKIQNDPLVFPQDPSCKDDPLLRDLLTGMLTKDPHKRLNLLQVMLHPWVTKNETADNFNPQQPAPQITVSKDEIENAIDPRDRFAIIVNVRIQMMKRLHHARQEMIKRHRLTPQDETTATLAPGTDQKDKNSNTMHQSGSDSSQQQPVQGDSMLRVSASDSLTVGTHHEEDAAAARGPAAPQYSSSPDVTDQSRVLIRKNSGCSARQKSNKVAVAPLDHESASGDIPAVVASSSAPKPSENFKSMLNHNDKFTRGGSVDTSEGHRMLSHEETRYRSKMFTRKKPKSSVLKRDDDNTAASSDASNELAIDPNELNRCRSESETDKEEEDDVVAQSPQSLDELLLTTLSMPPLCKTNSSITPLTIQPLIVKRFNYNGSDSHCFYTENKQMQVGYAVACLQGRRNVQEDRFTVIPDVQFDESKPSGRLLNSSRDHHLRQGFVGLYDGHGGDACAQLLQESMHQWLFQSAFSPRHPEEITNCCADVDKYLCQQLLKQNDSSGSTGTFVVLNQEMDRLKQLVIGHVGDCRVVLGTNTGEAEDLTTDHRVNSTKEYQRVVQLGGNVVNNRVNGVLSVTRAFGDLEFKGLISRKDFGSINSHREDENDKLPALLTSVPDVCTLEIDLSRHHFFLLACDGLWDVMSSQEAVQMVHDRLKLHKNPEMAAKELAQEAIRRFSNDNITVVLIILLQPH